MRNPNKRKKPLGITYGDILVVCIAIIIAFAVAGWVDQLPTISWGG